MKRYVLPLLFALQTCGTPLPASAKPPPGMHIDPEVHAWFERQTNQHGTSCCNVADGHVLESDEWRQSPDSSSGYSVLIGGTWWPIDSYAMRKANLDDPNPTGQAVAWYVWEEGGPLIYCFTPGAEY